MNQTTLNAILLSIGAVAVLYALLVRSLLLGVFVVLFLLTVSLLYRLVVAVERLADNAAGFDAATTDGGRSGSGRRTSEDGPSDADWDDEERPPVEERSTDELFE